MKIIKFLSSLFLSAVTLFLLFAPASVSASTFYSENFSGTLGTHLEDHETHWVRNPSNPFIILNGDNTAGVAGLTHYWWNSTQSANQNIQYDFKVHIVNAEPNQYGIIFRENGGDGDFSDEQVYVNIASDYSGSLFNSTGSISHSFPSGYFVEGEWHTLQATYDINDTVTAYVDGVFIDQWQSVRTVFPTGSFGINVMNGSIRNLTYGDTIPSISLLTTLNPAKVWVGVSNILQAGVKFDLLAEVYKDSTVVSSGQINSFSPGNTGLFVTANLATIPFSSFTPVDFATGSALKMKVSVRNACSGSLRNQGIARLWYNDSQANSQFGATITSSNDYFLRDGFVLATTAGSGPKKTIDVQSGAKCSAFKIFGTWTITP